MDVNQITETAERAETLAPLPPELASYQDEEAPEVGGAWKVANIQDADWALSRLAQCAEEVEAIDRQLEAAIAKATARAEKLKAQARRGVSFFEFRLAEWAETHRGEIVRGRKKSRAFLHGTIGFRAAGGRLKVQDKDALEAWLLAQPIEKGLYRMKVEAEMKALQEHFKATGEIPPGCEYDPEREDLQVKAAMPGTALAKE